MDISDQKILVVTDREDEWSDLSDQLICVPQCRQARIKLLEDEVDGIIFDVISSSEHEQLTSFIESLRGHPKLSSLLVFVCSSLLEETDSTVYSTLEANNATVISGPDYFKKMLTDASGPSAGGETGSDSFELFFSGIKEHTAKSLAKLKIEQRFMTGSTGTVEEEVLIERFLEILNKSLKG
jgi:hypothetical protein